jgi:tetratricopeptide (TPR) repeat protein
MHNSVNPGKAPLTFRDSWKRQKFGHLRRNALERGSVRSARIARKLSFAAAVLGALGMFGLAGCELPLLGVAAIYSKAHGPDGLSNAFVSLRRDDCSSADSEFAAILAAEPNNPQANYGRADALVCLGKYNDAIAYYSRAIKLDPKWFQYLGRGLAYKAPSEATS